MVHGQPEAPEAVVNDQLAAVIVLPAASLAPLRFTV
jgi:hypothetical protein